MLFCFNAPEEERISYEIEKFIQSFIFENPNLKTHRIEEEEIDDLISKLKSQNLFGEKFFYHINNIEEKKPKEKFWDNLLFIYENRLMQHYFLFGIIEIPDHKIFKTLKQNHRLFSFESIKLDKEWFKVSDEIMDKILKKYKKNLTYEARILLKEKCKGDPLKLKNELEKICLYVLKEKIEKEIIEKFCEEEQSEPFGLKKAIEKRDVDLYYSEVKKLLKEGQPPILIFSIIAKELKFLTILKSYLKKEEEILSKEMFIKDVYPALRERIKGIEKIEQSYRIRFSNPFSLFYSYEALPNYELKELIELQEKINQYNLNIRSGSDPEELVLGFGFYLKKKGN